MSLPVTVKVDLRGLDFNGLVEAIQKAAAAACREILGWMVRAIERQAMAAQPDRWINRGQQNVHAASSPVAVGRSASAHSTRLCGTLIRRSRCGGPRARTLQG